MFSQAYAIPCADMVEPQKTLCKQNKRILRKLNNLNPGACSAGLVSSQGACYGFGGVGESCTNFCSSKGMTGAVDSLDVNSCAAVADDIGLTYSSVSDQGYSCNMEAGKLYYKPGGGASAGTIAPNTRRICECR